MLVLSIMFIVSVVLVGLDNLIILDVMVLIDATIICVMPVLGVIFATFVAPVGLFEFGLALGVVFVIPTTLTGFTFGVEMTGLLEIGITTSCSSYIK